MPVDETAIRQWADRHECRRNLPILLRRLIRETASSLVSLRFPGNEAVDLAGLDGQVETGRETPWVPLGRSVWEMGCDQNPRTKANRDYQKRTDETSEEGRENTSFVFVTPRRWNEKNEWLDERRREGSWRAVYAYDAIDLETWLEESPVSSRWIGELLGIADPNLLTPHEWWRKWATASAPPLTQRLVATRRHGEGNILLEKLRAGDAVVLVVADDREEAVAFVVAALIESDALDLLDRTLVATSGTARISPSASRMIVIVDTPEGEEPALGDRRNFTIVRAYPKGRLDVREPLQLSHVPSDVFRSELEVMGIPRFDAETLARHTGHSVPVLRRQLSPDPEIRRPVWARDRISAKRILPFALAGSWVEREDKSDDTVIQLLGELLDGDVERICDELLGIEDAPVARYGNVNLVVSQLDALFAMGPYIERADLDRFFQLVPELLGDRDPALDLPQDQWWMANALGAERDYSEALLSGLGDALCILSVHGAEICGERLDIDLAHRAGQVVRTLMLGADEERWLTIRNRLRTLAEASPNTFLDCLEEALRAPEPAIRAIMGVAEGPMSGECLRTDLLWALELLAWQPAHFSRVAAIVLDLQRFEIRDNWANSPESTAQALFRAWLPSTSIGVAERMRVLRRLSGRFRRAVIKVCISLLPHSGPSFASRTARPQWRALEEGVSEPTEDDVRDSATEASRLLLDMAPFSKAELLALLDVIIRLHPDDLARLVVELERWSETAIDDEKAELRNELRRCEVMLAYQQRDEDLDAAVRRMETALEPATAATRNRWLFDSPHVDWRAVLDEENEDQLSWQERDERIRQRRASALEEVREELGDDQLVRFAVSTKHPDLVAQVLILPETQPGISASWIRRALVAEQGEAADAFLRQLLWNASWNDLDAVVEILRGDQMLDDEAVRQRLAKLLPGCAPGWSIAEALGGDAARVFWQSASICIWDETPADEIQFAVDRLLEAERPRSAFAAVGLWSNRVRAETWVQILQAISYGQESDAQFPTAYQLDEVLGRLDAAEEISGEQVATLELPFIPLLCRYGHRDHQRTLAVHRELARDPALFVQLLCWQYRRRDGTADPGQEDVTEDRREFLATIAFHALKGWNTVPGLDEEGEFDQELFASWAGDMLRLAAEVDRKGVAESHLGAMLGRFARRRSWDDWLPGPVLDFLDHPENEGLRRSFGTGVRNARGVTTRGPYDGGEQERRLAGRYRELAARSGHEHPRVSALLTSIAEGYEREGRQQDERAAVGERWNP